VEEASFARVRFGEELLDGFRGGGLTDELVAGSTDEEADVDHESTQGFEGVCGCRDGCKV
jgi:hypothetical protein